MRITKRNKFILIDKYLDGDLTREDANKIETRIKEDIEFAKEVEFSKSIYRLYRSSTRVSDGFCFLYDFNPASIRAVARL